MLGLTLIWFWFSDGGKEETEFLTSIFTQHFNGFLPGCEDLFVFACFRLEFTVFSVVLCSLLYFVCMFQFICLNEHSRKSKQNEIYLYRLWCLFSIEPYLTDSFYRVYTKARCCIIYTIEHFHSFHAKYLKSSYSKRTSFQIWFIWFRKYHLIRNNCSSSLLNVKQLSPWI